MTQYTLWLFVMFSLGVSTASDAAELQRVEVPGYRAIRDATFDIGALIQSGAVQPRDGITVDEPRDGCWLLRTPQGPPEVRWPRNLLNVRAGAPDLVVEIQLEGVYDVYAMVRAVDLGGLPGADDKARDGLPMAFVVPFNPMGEWMYNL